MSELLIAEVLERSDLLVDRPAIDAAIASMADAIAHDYIGDVPPHRLGDSFVPVFLTVMHGALPFAGQLALELGARGLDLQFDYLHATRYRGQNQGGELVWKHRPATSLYGRRVLIADDILDEGHTWPKCAAGASNRAPPTCASPRSRSSSTTAASTACAPTTSA